LIDDFYFGLIQGDDDDVIDSIIGVVDYLVGLIVL